MDVSILPTLIAASNDPEWYIKAAKKMCSHILAREDIYLTDEYLSNPKNIKIDKSEHIIHFRAKNGWIGLKF